MITTWYDSTVVDVSINFERFPQLAIRGAGFSGSIWIAYVSVSD